MSRTALISWLAVIALIGLGGWWLAAPKSSVVSERADIEPPRASGGHVPDISLTDYEGKTVHLTDFAGKPFDSAQGTPLVINSWAAWCPFCGKELADFATVQKELGDRVAMIAVDRAESSDVAKEFTDQLGISNDLVFLLDPRDTFYQAIGGFSMPETLFVKADGTIHFHKRGPMTLEEIRQRTQELLQ